MNNTKIFVSLNLDMLASTTDEYSGGELHAIVPIYKTVNCQSTIKLIVNLQDS